MIGKLFGLATGSWWGILGTAAVGAALAIAATVTIDNRLVHGPAIAGLNKKLDDANKVIGRQSGQIEQLSAAVKDRDGRLKALGAHERGAAEREATACAADVDTALKRGIAIGKAVCRARTPQ